MGEVLVTGGSGFVGSHAIVQLLAAGYGVRTTVRSLRREAEVRGMVAAGGEEAGDRLRFFEASLEGDEGWAEAAAGCEYVLHVASPFPVEQPKDEDELIVPAREGALRVLRAARDAGVKRVVLTSSFAAIGYGHPPQREEVFDETMWTDVEGPGVWAYMKSKTLAERAAWEFIEREGGGLELAVVNPVAIFGPVLGRDVAASIEIVKRMMEGKVPACPRLIFGVVDVRDVVDLHLRAMVHPEAKGERFLAVAGRCVSLLEVARMLRVGLGADARKVSTRPVPDWVVRVGAVFVPLLRQIAPQLGIAKECSNEKARRVLGWMPRSNEEAVVAAGESLVRFGWGAAGKR